jgi:hypothetical protein
VRCPFGTIGVSTPKDSRWRGLILTGEEVAKTGTLWVYDIVRVRVEVGLEGNGPKPAAREILVRGVLPYTDQGPDPWNRPWLASHGLRPGSLDGRPDETRPETHLVEVPRLEKLTVTAWAKGWRPSSAEVHVPADVPEMEVRLTLIPGLTISGTVHDEAGQPIADAIVHVFVVRWLPREGSRPLTEEESRKQSPNGGVGITAKEGRMRVRVHELTRTNSRGEFTAYTKSEGHVGVYIYEPGRRAARADMGELSENKEGLDFVLSPVKGDAFLVFSESGAPVIEEPIGALDMTDPIRPPIELRTDGRGRVPADWLQAGHQYHFIRLRRQMQGVMGFLRYESQSEIDFSLLSKAPPSDK